MDAGETRVRLSYPGPERLANEYRLIKAGKIYVPSAEPKPVGAGVILEFQLAEFDRSFAIATRVESSFDREAAQKLKRSPGMTVAVTEEGRRAIAEMDAFLSNHERYRKPLGITPTVDVDEKSPTGLIDLEALVPRRKGAAPMPAPSAPIPQPSLTPPSKPKPPPPPPPARPPRGAAPGALQARTAPTAAASPTAAPRPAPVSPTPPPQPAAVAPAPAPPTPPGPPPAAAAPVAAAPTPPPSSSPAPAAGAQPSTSVPASPAGAPPPAPPPARPADPASAEAAIDQGLSATMAAVASIPGVDISSDVFAATDDGEVGAYDGPMTEIAMDASAPAAPAEETPPPPPSPPAAPPSPPPPAAAAAAAEPSPEAAPPELAQPDLAPSELAPGQTKLGWLRDMFDEKDYDDFKDEAPTETPPPVVDKKTLTLEERERLRPVGEFIMNMTKAMLRTGYYSPDHPGSFQAKHGLYNDFKVAMAEDRELSLSIQDAQEKSDVVVMGILADAVSARVVVGPGMADLFVPKIREFFSRKGLLTLAIRNDITEEHFDQFVDIMSDPKADQGERGEVGGLLTGELAKRKIFEISTVFTDDIFLLDKRLPWRVQVAILRLSKDLKILPMFDTATEEEMNLFKFQRIQDIIRPLRQPNYLRDIVVNSHIVARHIQHTEERDLQRMLVNALPRPLLLFVARTVFEAFETLKKELAEQPDHEAVRAKLECVIVILRFMTRRMVDEEIKGSLSLIEDLFFAGVVPFAELPPPIQYRINTIRLARDMRERPEDYEEILREVFTPADANIFLRCFRRVTPLMIEQRAWWDLRHIIRLVNVALTENPIFRGPDLPPNPLEFIFLLRVPLLVEGYDRSDKSEREDFNQLLSDLGPMGLTVLTDTLATSGKLDVRKAAISDLIKMRDLSRPWVRSVLDDPSKPWYLQRNSLLALGEIGEGKEDLNRALRYAKHPHPRLREEFLTTLLKLNKTLVPSYAIHFLADSDLRVQRRALGCLSALHPLSREATHQLLEVFLADRPKDKDELKTFERRATMIARALGNMEELTGVGEVEDALSIFIKNQLKAGGLLDRLRGQGGGKADNPAVLTAVEALGKLGAPSALTLLEKLAGEEKPLADKALEAANRIKLRHA